MKKGDWFWVYWFGGMFTVCFASYMRDIPMDGDKWADNAFGPVIAVFIFWPVFAVKYLALFAWYILTSGYTALV